MRRLSAKKWDAEHPEKMREYKRKYRERNREKIRAAERARRDPEKERARAAAYYAANREEINRRQRLWRQQNRPKSLAWAKQWQAKNREKYLKCRRELRATKAAEENARTAEWRKGNRDRIRAYDRARRAVRIKSDLNYAIRERLRTRIRVAIKEQSGAKAKRTMELIGCSVRAVRLYIQEKFEPGMTWENWGRVWHLDHIIPCAAYDLKRPDHQLACFHFSNLQPLFARDNIIKGASVPAGVALPC